MAKQGEEFSWVGSQAHFVDTPDVLQLGKIVVGRYGGNSSAGQYKNEDGCLVWFNGLTRLGVCNYSGCP